MPLLPADPVDAKAGLEMLLRYDLSDMHPRQACLRLVDLLMRPGKEAAG